MLWLLLSSMSVIGTTASEGLAAPPLVRLRVLAGLTTREVLTAAQRQPHHITMCGMGAAADRLTPNIAY
jgi:hypothetical protein